MGGIAAARRSQGPAGAVAGEPGCPCAAAAPQEPSGPTSADVPRVVRDMERKTAGREDPERVFYGRAGHGPAVTDTGEEGAEPTVSPAGTGSRVYR